MPHPAPRPPDRFHAFISYTRADAGDRVDTVAGNLDRLGFHLSYARCA